MRNPFSLNSIRLAALATVLLAAACSPPADEPVNTADTVVSSDEAVIMFNTLPIDPAQIDAFLPVMRANVAASRDEPGNISFDAYQLEEGGDDLFLLERWESQAALDTHMETPHLLAVADAASAALSSPKQSVLLREISQPAPWPPVTDPASTRNLIVSLQVRPERRDAFVEALLATVAPSRAAPGNLGFDIYEHRDDRNALVIVERWTNPAAHEAHLEQPYNAPLNAIFEESLAQPLADGRRLLRDVSVTPQG